MNETNFEISFNERRSFSHSKKRTYYIIGVLEIGIGMYGLIRLIDETPPFYWILLIGGILSIVNAFIGKYPFKEKNFISIKPEIIEFKNSTQRPKAVLTSNLLDVLIESNKAEFITNEQEVRIYEFSIFPKDKIKKLHVELEKIKTKLISK